MNTPKRTPGKRRGKTTSDAWPLKLNKALIVIGVIAFGLIVTDRLLEAFKADDAPAKVTSIDDSGAGTDQSASASQGAVVADQTLPVDRESLTELKNLFGSRVVFVSVTEPGYIVTEDERRIAVGEAVDDATTLAGVTTHQLILEKSGDLMIFRLPDPVVQ
jgi:hypothetical protein